MRKRVLWGIALFCCNLFSQYIYESDQSLVDLTNQTGVTWLTSGDDSISSAFNLGFDFTFYEQTFSTARMATNGCLHFGSSGSGCNDYTPDPLGQTTSYYTIYPFWTDLIAVDANAKMAAKSFNDKIVFGWYKMQEYYRQSSYNSFEVILWNNNTYDIRYGDLDIVDHDVLIGEQGNSSQTYTYYFHDECNTGSTNGTNCYSYDWNASDKNTNLEAGGSLYGEGDGLDCSDPLNDSSCDGYEEAYLAQQCNLDALYSTSCSGYDQAYQDQQCSIDALYSTECSGYEQAYRDYECEKDPQYSPTCSGYIPEVIGIMAIQTAPMEYETFQITEDEVILYTDPVEEEQFEQFDFNETYQEDIFIDPIIDVLDTYEPVTQTVPINVFDAEELLEIFTTTEIIEEIEEFIEEEPIEEIIEEEFVEELIVEENFEEIIEEEFIEEVIETFEETPKGNSIASALKVVAQTLQTANESYTKQNNIGNDAQAAGISTTSSPSISDQIMSANMQNNTVLQLSDSIGDNSITITPLFTLDNAVMSDVQINDMQDQILTATSNVMTSSEADKIADQILANNLKQEQEEMEEEQQESGEYADQTAFVAYLGYVPGFNRYKDVSIPDQNLWYESKIIYTDARIDDNTNAYYNLANTNINKMQTILQSQVNL